MLIGIQRIYAYMFNIGTYFVYAYINLYKIDNVLDNCLD